MSGPDHRMGWPEAVRDMFGNLIFLAFGFILFATGALLLASLCGELDSMIDLFACLCDRF